MSSTVFEVPVEVLLRHREWVRALAFRLVGRDAESDDIVQQTFTSALRSPPTERGAVKGWLREVVKNAVAEMRRGDGRRERREVAAAVPEASVSDVSEIAARVEMQRVVVSAVEALPEHYRATIHLRYFGGLSREQMAAELGVSEEAVKSRLARAIDRLRADLTNRLGVDDGGLELALLPLLTWPRLGPVVASEPKARPRRRRAARRAAVAAALTLALVAGLAASYRTLTAPRASAGGAGPAGPDPVGQPWDPPQPRPRTEEPQPEPRVPDELGAPQESANSSVPPGEATGSARRITRITLVGWSEELGDVRLRVVAHFPGSAAASPERTVIARCGVAVLDADALAAPGSTPVLYVVTVDHPDLVPQASDVPASLHPDRATEAEVELTRATKIRGTVAGPDGAPATGARVAVVRRLFATERCVEVDSCDVAPDGRFELRADPTSAGSVIAAAFPLRVDSVAFRRPAELANAPLALRLTPAASVTGRVEYETDGPTCDTVALQFDGEEYGAGLAAVAVGWRDGRFELTDQSAVVGPDGTFKVEGVAPGKVLARASGRAIACSHLPSFSATGTAPGEPLVFRVPGIPLRVRLSEQGRPMVGARVSATGANGSGGGETDEAGVIVLRVEPGVRLTIQVWDRPTPFRQEFTPSDYAGEPEEVAIDLPREPVFEWRVRLRGPDGSPVERAYATVTERRSKRSVLSAARGQYDAATGALLFRGIPAGDYVVEIGVGEAVHDPTRLLSLGRAEVSLPAPRDHVEELTLRTGGRLVVRASDSHGEWAPIREASLVPERGEPIPVEFVRRGGGDLASRALPLAVYYDVYPVVPSGTYRLVFDRSERDAVERTVVITEGDTTVVDVELPD